MEPVITWEHWLFLTVGLLLGGAVGFVLVGIIVTS